VQVEKSLQSKGAVQKQAETSAAQQKELDRLTQLRREQLQTCHA